MQKNSTCAPRWLPLSSVWYPGGFCNQEATLCCSLSVKQNGMGLGNEVVRSHSCQRCQNYPTHPSKRQVVTRERNQSKWGFNHTHLWERLKLPILWGVMRGIAVFSISPFLPSSSSAMDGTVYGSSGASNFFYY
jgi:hypothetical protein